ncbi:MAG: aspartate--tRNA ligase, partial [Kiritimatiellae bacterium]|nr:aspartate--tRNA ligase [Kiritimatiellia bacterium]
PVKGIASQPRSFFDKLEGYAKEQGAKGLGYISWKDGELKGPIVKFMTPAELDELAKRGNMTEGDVMFFMCDKPAVAAKLAGDIRLKLGRDLNMIDKDVYKFCWIVDFPMFERDEETGDVIFSHNPFSMPQGGMDSLLNKDPLDILAYQYDVVCNGVELSSGAIRNHSLEIMLKAFDIAGYAPEVVFDRFPALSGAFKYGAPPHGGIAPGVDRMVMLLADAENIREVIAFPMNQRAQDLMMNAPAPVTEKQLRELHIKVRAQNVQPNAPANA